MFTQRESRKSGLQFRKNTPAARRPRPLPLRLQTLESREIPSVAPIGLTPSALKHAYGIDALTFSGITANGLGQTIAIVQFGDDPGMVSSTAPGFATSDLKMFDMALGIPDPPSFLKVNQTGGTVYPAPSAGASTEISLDVEYAHAMAPAASIVLVEAASGTYPDLIAAATYASHLPGVSVVSNSYGDPFFAPESVDELTIDKTYAVPGVTFVFSTGDFGSPGHYPAYSPYVVAVGGTSLSLAGSEYGMETGWSGSGGGISAFESKPAYQFAVPTTSATKRTIPDVSFDADPASGVAVLCSYVNPPGSPWMDTATGGTSLAAPCFAGIFAIVNQGRAINGLAPLNSGATSEVHSLLYGLPPMLPDYHDITSGSNGAYSAKFGYDLVTGIGSPTGMLIIDLAGGPLPVFTVSTTADSGAGSLRKAVADEATMGFGKIVFDKSVFGTAKTITLTTGALAITTPVTISGPGSGLLTIKNGGASRIFTIDTPGSGASVALSGMDLKMGFSGTHGGAIYDEDEALTLTDVIVESSTASLSGGGIYVNMGPGSLSLTNCIVRNNTVTATTAMGTDNGTGGGIGIHGPSMVTITSTTISGNTAKGGGGGIYAFLGGMITLTGTTISGNVSTGGDGAGIGLHFGGSSAKLLNTTVSGNTATLGSGGGIAMLAGAASLMVQNSTIAFNTAAGSGGGVWVSSGTASIESTIIADNTCSGSPDLSGSVTEYFSLIGDTTGATISGSGNKNGLDPLLGALSLANGGPTATHALAAGSPAINSGSNPTSAIYDQRGVGYPRAINFIPDMGAFEYVPSTLMVFTTADSGPGSLREAITESNLAVGTQSITFAPPFGMAPMTISLSGGPITISDATTITGPGAGLLTISGSVVTRVFLVDDGNPLTSIPVTLSGVTVSGGFTPGDFGGAIRCNGESLTIAKCTFMDNAAPADMTGVGGGGAVAIFSGSLTITDSTFKSNSAGMAQGGAIFGYPDTLTVQRSTFTGNSAYVGGAIYVGGTTLIDSCLISGNSATGSASSAGGGLLFENFNFSYAFTVRNTTVTGNTAGASGGGIELVGTSLGLTVQNSTIAGNFVLTGSIGGGGIARVGAAAAASPVSLESTIVQGNFAPGANKDLYSLGAVTAKFCDIGTAAGVTTFTADATTMALLGVDPMLLPLMDNGGATMTRALSPFSPVVNKGSNPMSLTTDQRGTGFVRVVGTAADIGAYEVQPPPKVTMKVIGDGSAQRSRVTSVTITIDSVVGISAGAFELKRQSDSKLVDLTVSVAYSAVTTVTLTFLGALSENGSLADGRYTLTIDATKVSNINGFLDGNGDGTGGDNYVLASAMASTPPDPFVPPTNIFRLFGDADGSGHIDLLDFAAFRGAYGTTSSAFSFDGTGPVDLLDFAQFRTRYGMSV